GTRAEAMRIDDQFLGQLAIAEDLELVKIPLGQVLLAEIVRSHSRARLEQFLEFGHVHGRDFYRELVVIKAALRNPPDERRTATGEDRRARPTCVGPLPLVPLACGLALARTGATTDALGAAML